MRRVAPCAALLAATLAGSPLAASVSAVALREPINPNHAILSTSSINTGDFAFADIVSTIGFAQASASTTAGRIAAQSQVTLFTSDDRLSGVFTSRSSATQLDTLKVGEELCDSSGCTSAGSLGIALVEFDFRVRASGTVAAAVLDSRFDRATSSIAYGWSLSSGAVTAAGGGRKIGDSSDGITGEIGSQMGTITARPGDALQLLLAANLESRASLASFRFSGFDSASSTTNADFSHTLEWDGIFGLRAFDAAGAAVSVGGKRFALLDEQGNDFWFGASRFGAVPEPASWAMMIAGFGMAGAACRRALVRGAVA